MVLTADMVYRNSDNLESNITIIEPPNLIQPNENNENNENSENIIVDILPPSEQEVKPDAVSTNVSNVPYLLHYDINEHEGMM